MPSSNVQKESKQILQRQSTIFTAPARGPVKRGAHGEGKEGAHALHRRAQEQKAGAEVTSEIQIDGNIINICSPSSKQVISSCSPRDHPSEMVHRTRVNRRLGTRYCSPVTTRILGSRYVNRCRRGASMGPFLSLPRSYPKGAEKSACPQQSPFRNKSSLCCSEREYEPHGAQGLDRASDIGHTTCQPPAPKHPQGKTQGMLSFGHNPVTHPHYCG